MSESFASGPADEDLPALAERAAQAARGVEGVDAFEIRVDRRVDWRASVDGKKRTSSRTFQTVGLGARVFVKDQAAYVYVHDPTPAAVRDLVARGRDLARAQSAGGWRATAIPGQPLVARKATYLPKARWETDANAEARAIALLVEACRAAKERAPNGAPHASIGARESRVVVTDSLGSWIETGSLVSTCHTSIALEAARYGNGSARTGGELGIDGYASRVEPIGSLAADRALESARAVPLKGGRYRVLCDNELAGTLAHESFGHLTEHDLVASQWSSLRGRQGETLANDTVSVSDAPMVKDGAQGVVVPIDDQGATGEKVTMLDRGVLRRWLHTRESAHSTGDAPTGNGRALNSRFPAIVRMRNTFFEPGDRTLDEALEQLGDGVYLMGARGGAPQSDGSFMFTAMRGYLVENGRPTHPVRTAAIHGNVLDFLRNVECLTRDFEVTANYFGGCGKGDQSFLHVGVGGPHVLVSDALVGGA